MDKGMNGLDFKNALLVYLSQNKDNIHVIYHGNCMDGFTAAWIVKNALLLREYQFSPAMYNDAGPPWDKLTKDTILIIVDFSYKRPVTLDLAKNVKEVYIFDHHKSAREELVDLPENVQGVFDMERSGAGIAWDFFLPKQPRNPIVTHVEQRDLWRFSDPATRPINAALFSYDYDFAVWDEIFFNPNLARLVNDGNAIERKHLKDIKEFLRVAQRMTIIDGYTIPTLNCPYHWGSDACHIMAHDSAPTTFAAYYYDTEDKTVFGLRSDEGGLDVSAIAKKYGGGGHFHAAGFSLPRDAWPYQPNNFYPKD